MKNSMDLEAYRKKIIKDELKITEDYKRIFSFVDFSNVNNWFKHDTQDWDNRLITEEQKIGIDIDKLKEFSDIFSERTRCYYGKNPKNEGSLAFDYALKRVFGKHNFVSKDIQKIKHHIRDDEEINKKWVQQDDDGKDYIEIRKCNFDVEISVDAIKKLNKYDTFCLFSGDADFVYLNNFLRKNKKKVVLIKGGYITTKLRNSADLVVNAQKIKKHIAKIEDKTKQRPDKSGLCE